MKLAIVGTYPLDKNTIRGGVEAVVFNLVEGLRLNPELDIHVVSCRLELTRRKVVREGNVTLYYFPASRRFKNITLGLVEQYRTRQILDEVRPDLIHFQNPPAYAYTSGFRPPPCPAVLTIHGITYQEVKFQNGLVEGFRKYFRNQHERMVLRSVPHIIAVSPYVRQAIGHLTPAMIYPIDNPVGGKYFELHDRSAEARLLFVGFISRLKNVMALMRALTQVRCAFPEVKVRIAGAVSDPEYFREVEQYVREHQLQDQVRFLGHLPENRLWEEYEKCSLLVSTSLQENSPLAIQQAMAAGKAVVANRVGGVSHLVTDGETGFLVEPGDGERLAERIQLLLGNKPLREAFGKKSKTEALQRFTCVTVAGQTYRLYQELLARQRKGA